MTTSKPRVFFGGVNLSGVTYIKIADPGENCSSPGNVALNTGGSQVFYCLIRWKIQILLGFLYWGLYAVWL
jgi:hypothetical protein